MVGLVSSGGRRVCRLCRESGCAGQEATMTTTDQVNGALPRFSVTAAPVERGVLTLTVVGELDLATRETLDSEGAHALGQSSDTIVVDLSGVTFCGCAGLRSLVELNGQCRPN